MTKLIERTVQEKAIKYLAKYYRGRAKRGHLFEKMEVRTTAGKRADGLVAFKKKWTGRIYVASMESKSYKMQDVITPVRDTKHWIRRSFWNGLLIAIGTGIIFLINRIDSPLWSAIYAVGVWVVLSLIILFFTRNWNSNKTMEVLNQIDQYPGNEQWLSTSKDSYDVVPKHLQKAFTQVLKARGVGLLLVDKRLKVHLIHKPKKHRKFSGDFLKFYSKELEIKRFLN